MTGILIRILKMDPPTTLITTYLLVLRHVINENITSAGTCV